MKEILENGYIRLIASDWRYSAAIVGLKRFFDFLDIECYTYDSESFTYNQDVIKEENIIAFIDSFFGTRLKYNRVLSILEDNDSFDEKRIKEVNKLLSENEILKRVFSKEVFDGQNKDRIITLINENKSEFALNLFLNTRLMYQKYCNKSSFMKKDAGVCRIAGFYEDMTKKSKQIAWRFDKSTFEYHDCIEFDFIVFAFTYSTDSCFINSNYSLNSLFKLNDDLKRSLKDKESISLADTITSITDLISYNCEVIVNKNNENNYFESIFFSPTILENINRSKNYIEHLGWINKNDNWLNLKEIAYDCLINNMYLDSTIIELLKNQELSYNIDNLIKINFIICGKEKNMENIFKSAIASANSVKQKVDDNKVKSYQQKLISALYYNNKNKVIDLLTNLSAYSGVSFYFIYDLLIDFDSNKNVVYYFVNKLNENKQNEKKED